VDCNLIRRLIDETPVILGSASARRERILTGLGLDFVVDRPDLDETPVEGEGAEEHVLRLSLAKARAVGARHERGTLVAADTAVLIDGLILGKPVDAPDAVRMLGMIRGRWHEVLTGVAVLRCSDGAWVTGVERTRVLVRPLTDGEIEGYVAGGEPLDKAGSYGIQECGAAVVERVEGCFYNVVGLPVARLCRLLEELRTAGTAAAPEGAPLRESERGKDTP